MKNHLKNIIFTFFIAFFGLSSCAVATEMTVDIQATGVNAADAINNGLMQAIQQVTGVRINALVVSDLKQANQATNGTDSYKLDEQLQQNIKKDINGVIKEYRIISSEPQPNAGVEVKMTVVIDKYTEVGLSSDSRRKLAIMPFSDPAGRITQAGTALQTSLIAYIVKARRFAVVDRSNSSAYDKEMSLITSGQTQVKDQARLGQVLSADYVLTGTMRPAQSSNTQMYLPITGEVLNNVTSTAGRVDFSLMEVATRQVKYAGNVDANGSNDAIAEKIGSLIIDAIYPLRIVDASDPTELVINQGGDGLKPGQRFTAYVLGTEQFDPYTKESLGRREKESAQIEITRVLPKMSYAKVIKGSVPGSSDIEIVLRKMAVTPPKNRTAGPSSPQPQDSGITKLPFDK